jgi:hypothetical protein
MYRGLPTETPCRRCRGDGVKGVCCSMKGTFRDYLCLVSRNQVLHTPRRYCSFHYI